MEADNKKLEKLPVKELAKKVICNGHLFLMSGERKFYLMKPGVFVDPNFIKAHAARDQIFDFESVINDKVYTNFKKLFHELRYLQFEADLRKKCIEIIKSFHSSFSTGEHFLAFAIACYEEFCEVSFDDLKRINDVDLNLFRKSLYSAAFAVIIGISNDFYDFMMLKDFYNISFSLDIGLCEESYSYYVAEACNAENVDPGKGLTYLEEQKATVQEKEVYLAHPKKSYEFIKNKSFLSFPELAEIVLYQHELTNGTGFPRGVAKGQVSSWEAVVILSDALVEIRPDYDFETDVLSYLQNFKNKKIHDLPVGRIYKKMCSALTYFSQLKETGT